MREQLQRQYPEDEGQADADSVPSIIGYPEILWLILSFWTTTSWCFLSETSKLASNTASFSFVVNVDGIKTLEEGEETLLFTLAALAE